MVRTNRTVRSILRQSGLRARPMVKLMKRRPIQRKKPSVSPNGRPSKSPSPKTYPIIKRQGGVTTRYKYPKPTGKVIKPVYKHPIKFPAKPITLPAGAKIITLPSGEKRIILPSGKIIGISIPKVPPRPKPPIWWWRGKPRPRPIPLKTKIKRKKK